MKKYILEKYNIDNKAERESFVSVGNQHKFMYRYGKKSSVVVEYL